jgi:integrase
VELPQYLVPLAVVAYNVGVRRGELLCLEWSQVDFTRGVIRLYCGRTKAGDPRMVPMIGRMRDVLLQAKTRRDDLFPESPWLFSRLGERIRSFTNTWSAACSRAGFSQPSVFTTCAQEPLPRRSAGACDHGDHWPQDQGHV